MVAMGLLEAHAGEVNALKEERGRLAAQLGGFALRGDQAEARTDSLRARVDVLQRERNTARAESAQAAEALRQAEAVRKVRGAWWPGPGRRGGGGKALTAPYRQAPRSVHRPEVLRRDDDGDGRSDDAAKS